MKKIIDVNENVEKQMWEPCEDYISRRAVKELYYKDGYIDFRKICELPSVNPQPNTDVLGKIRAEIKEWYWQADKQALAKDPCVVDAMIDLFIRTVDKYKTDK